MAGGGYKLTALQTTLLYLFLGAEFVCCWNPLKRFLSLDKTVLGSHVGCLGCNGSGGSSIEDSMF